MPRPRRFGGRFYLSDLLTFILLAGLPAALGLGGDSDINLWLFVLSVVAGPAVMWWSVSFLDAVGILQAWKRSLFHVYAVITWIALVGTPMLLTAAFTRDPVLFERYRPLGVLLVIGDLGLVASFIYLNHLRKRRLGLKVCTLPIYCARWGAFLAVAVLIFWAPMAGNYSRARSARRRVALMLMNQLSSSLRQYESAHPGFALETETETERGAEERDVSVYWLKRKGILVWCGAVDGWGRPLVIRILPVEPADKTDPRLFRFGQRWLLIYSTGPNQEDDNGQGDDVPIEESRR